MKNLGVFLIGRRHAMDNDGTAKEGMGRTYSGVDGYCPLAAYTDSGS